MVTGGPGPSDVRRHQEKKTKFAPFDFAPLYVAIRRPSIRGSFDGR